MNAIAFEISNLRRHEGKSLAAFFDVTLPGVVIRDCRLHVGRKGAFVAGPGARSSFAVGGWQTHAEIDDDLARDIQEAVEARLVADAGGENAA